MLKIQPKRKNKEKTVSEKVTELILQQNGANSSEESDKEATAPRVEDFDEDYDLPDARSTEIRKRNEKLLLEQSARYRGKIASRKDFEIEEDDNESDEENEEDDNKDDDDDDEEAGMSDVEMDESSEQEYDSDENSDSEALKAFKKKLSGKEQTKSKKPAAIREDIEDSDDEAIGNGTVETDEEDDDDSDNDDDDDDADDDSDDDDNDEEDADGNENDATDIIAETNRQAEIQKGHCVQNQLHIWERLLEFRIHSQKLLNKANQLPAPDELRKQQKENAQLQQITKETTEKTNKLLHTLLELQSTLYAQYGETRNALKANLKRPSPFHDGTPTAKRIADHLHSNFTDFRVYRNAVLLKWDDRTKILTPGAGAKKKSLTEEYDIIRKIDNTLMNRNVNQQQNGEYGMEKAVPQEEARNVNIYDDSDFYHQQLRELIEYKANVSSNMSEITKQYIELQQLRQKMKKKVDTRASKGRKIRYIVHNKLVNFMAPDETDCTWTEESTNELCKSLFAT